MENFLTSSRNRYLIFLGLVGTILIGGGIFFSKMDLNTPSTKVEVLNAAGEVRDTKEITVEVSGSVIKPGVYKLADGSRVEDLIIISGGFSLLADRNWVDKYLNRASKLTDGQKVYIPQSGSESAKNNGVDQNTSPAFSPDSNGLININSADLKSLDSLPGIGPVYAQNIIEHRPYSILEELVSKGAIKQSLYDKIKNLISVY